jgi:uncharacterized protein with HEPN domain
MSPRSWTERVRDILDAIAEIEGFVADMTDERFAQDHRTQKAVVADLVILGEAAASIPDDIAERYSDVPWRLMRDMRNRLIHIYFEIDHAIVWETIQKDLPVLGEQLKALLRDNAAD